MYLNLFFKSVKADAAVAVTSTDTEGATGSEIATERAERGERVKALIRRFLQVLVSGGGGAPEFIAGGLYLLGEVGVVVSLFFFFFCYYYSLLYFLTDISDIDMLSFSFFMQLFSSVPGLRSMINDPPNLTSSTQEGSSYDPRKREPQFAHASALPLWELVRATHLYIYITKKPYSSYQIDSSPLALPPSSISTRPATPHKRTTHSVA